MTKRAMVTGASEGIGYEIAKRLKQAGYEVTGVARSEAKLASLVREIGGDTLQADLSTEAGQDAVVARLASQKYDLLVNNAGVGVEGAFTDAPLDKQLAMMRLNCDALVKLSYAYLKGAVRGDTLVNVSSVLAYTPLPGMAVYSATKAFVTAFSETLWFEQKARGVHVMGLHPGITTTSFQTAAGGNSADLPKGLSQSAPDVAEFAVREIEKRSGPNVISGKKNVAFKSVTRMLPRPLVMQMMTRNMKH
jgi:short-subunit dehydrogenase